MTCGVAPTRSNPASPPLRATARSPSDSASANNRRLRDSKVLSFGGQFDVAPNSVEQGDTQFSL